jgi:hypothetical protein
MPYVLVNKHSRVVVAAGQTARAMDNGTEVDGVVYLEKDLLELVQVADADMPADFAPGLYTHASGVFAARVDVREKLREEGREEIRKIVREAALASTIDGAAKQRLKDKGVL